MRILPERRHILATHTHLAEVYGQSRVCVLPALFPILARPRVLLLSWAAQPGLGCSPAAHPRDRRMCGRCLPGVTHFKNLLKQKNQNVFLVNILDLHYYLNA